GPPLALRGGAASWGGGYVRRPYRSGGGGAFRAPLTFAGWGCERKWGVVFISGGRRIRTCSFSVMSAGCFRCTSPRCARGGALVKRRWCGSFALCAPRLRLCSPIPASPPALLSGGGGKTTPWPSRRLHVKVPANIV